jgi:hypothetical protein
VIHAADRTTQALAFDNAAPQHKERAFFPAVRLDRSLALVESNLHVAKVVESHHSLQLSSRCPMAYSTVTAYGKPVYSAMNKTHLILTFSLK